MPITETPHSILALDHIHIDIVGQVRGGLPGEARSASPASRQGKRVSAFPSRFPAPEPPALQ